MRDIIYTEKIFIPYSCIDGKSTPSHWIDGESFKGKFHGFFQYADGGSDGLGNAECLGIIELEDGTVKEVQPSWIKFIKEKEND